MRAIVRFQLVLCLVGLAAGGLGLWVARDVDVTASTGGQIGWRAYEINLMTYNKLGALVTLALVVVGLVGVFALRPAIAFLPGAGFAVLAVQVLVQWRPDGGNLLASSGTNLSFALAMAIGFVATAWLSLVEPYRSDRPA
ncbi:MAG: hypothetical protein HYX32_06240 [Actinobacteria bacterium]|nr:hypothetical protein [Actinomycetota bacterium]